MTARHQETHHDQRTRQSEASSTGDLCAEDRSQGLRRPSLGVLSSPSGRGSSPAGSARAALDIIGAIADAVVERLGPIGSAPRLVSIRESRIPYRLALKAIADGTLPAYRVGRSTYLRVEDEDEWIARSEHRVRPGEPQSEAEPDEIGELIAISGRRSR